jgi:regulatory protein
VLRLRRKGYGDAAIGYAVAEAERLDLLDDAAFAAAWVRDRLKLRPRGARALIHELGRKGVAGDVARSAVEQVMASSGVSDAELCMAAAERWARTRAGTDADRMRTARRLAAFLARRGYSPAHIRTAVSVTVGSRRGA